jgi:hypothetical protein
LAEPARVQDGAARSPPRLYPSTSDTPIGDGLGPEIIGDQGIMISMYNIYTYTIYI